MASSGFINKKETKDNAISEEDYGHRLLGCRGVHLDYVQTLFKLRRALRDTRPGRKVILQHDNARPHTARLTLEKILRTWGGKFSLTLRTVPIWHPPFTISLVLRRIRCEAKIKSRMTHSRQLCVNVFGQLERSSAAREYSNFQHGWKNVYRETGIMWKNKQMSMD